LGSSAYETRIYYLLVISKSNGMRSCNDNFSHAAVCLLLTPLDIPKKSATKHMFDKKNVMVLPSEPLPSLNVQDLTAN
jgi:hypothetical protein